MNKELSKLLNSTQLDEDTKNKIQENPPKTKEELIRLATQLGVEFDFDADTAELNDSDLAKVSGGKDLTEKIKNDLKLTGY